jgi:hypothetical protein
VQQATETDGKLGITTVSGTNITHHERQDTHHAFPQVGALEAWNGLVARGGVEPPTFRFSVGRSYQLSYLAGMFLRS